MKRFIIYLTLWLLLLPILLSGCASSLSAELEETTTTVEEAETLIATAEEVIEQRDPGADGVLDIIIIGNSFSTGFPDEMYGLFEAAGIKADIYSVYYSGCSLAMHWNWLESEQAHYRLNHHVGTTGKREATEPLSLERCLKRENWDIISLQQDHTVSIKPGFNEDQFMDRSGKLAGNLYDYLKKNFPKSKLYWHQEWAYEIGYDRNEAKVPDTAAQEAMHKVTFDLSARVVKENGVSLVPSGLAWQIARRMGSGDLTRDGYHDGPQKGGQYLNACTWFEAVTGISCVGNTWRPQYKNADTGEVETIAEERIKLLQNAAHEAVTTHGIS